MRDQLDDIDWKIIRELQADGRMTNVEVARRVGISAPPCLRRIRALEEAGYIRGYRAMLDAARLGFPVEAFAFVQLVGNADADLAAFQKAIENHTNVREAWMLSGEVDFMLKCVARDLKSFQAFVLELTAAPNVKTVKTALTLGQTKGEAAVPF
ncbi:transcriptional regulator [Agaricicola taiwanensis]|uniref:Transcriptional regulator n=1 Tax=Agaricicola taiwanensis TaxID=591372 RepID=A0A8J2W216_9RHOB|nr:Lrp/AsnC family transcriptional regulator [Agaricicola taiwanensis]GGE42165.1 transcriptional regulator [Agaricicola taiwanensis]